MKHFVMFFFAATFLLAAEVPRYGGTTSTTTSRQVPVYTPPAQQPDPGQRPHWYFPNRTNDEVDAYRRGRLHEEESDSLLRPSKPRKGSLLGE